MSEKTDSRVTLCPDGKYRWVYEVPMLKNPSILYDVYKVLGISFGVVWLLNGYDLFSVASKKTYRIFAGKNLQDVETYRDKTLLLFWLA
jgi:hypothetical protein